MRKKFLYLTYYLSIAFILSAGFNYGVSGFFLAIPFSVYALLAAKSALRNKRLLYIVLVAMIFGYLVHATLEKNPLIFPILRDGYIEISQDGYQKTFSDGSGGFSFENEEKILCSGCGNINYHKVSKGERFPVTGINITHPDFGTKINLVTPIGQFSESDYLNEKNILLNKPMQSRIFSHLGDLVYLPITLILAKHWIMAYLPGTDVIVQDDFGNVRPAVLSNIVTDGRVVRTGDKIQLNCKKAIPFKEKQMCSIDFIERPESRIPSFSVTVDASGIPDPNLLKYQ